MKIPSVKGGCNERPKTPKPTSAPQSQITKSRKELAAKIEKTARGYRVVAADGTQTGSQLTLTEANRIMAQWVLIDAKKQGAQ